MTSRRLMATSRCRISQDLGTRNQALSVADKIFEQSLRVGLVRVRGADQIHWDIGIDQNEGCIPAPYPHLYPREHVADIAATR
jgi:hypothetical protein